MAYEYYAVLGVAPAASPEQIKDAYARKRREIATRRDEDALKLLLEAKTTLLEPSARANYDSYQQHGDEVERLQTAVVDAQEREQWEEAVRLLKRICVLLPREPGALNQLGVAHLRNGDPVDGVRVLERLVAIAPEVALYWSNLGTALIELGDLGGTTRSGGLNLACPHCGHGHYASHSRQYVDFRCTECGETSRMYADYDVAQYQLACEQLRKAIALEPKNPAPYLEVARAYCLSGRYEEAIEWARKGIGADGRTDINDLEDMFSLCLIYLLADRPQDLHRTAEEMRVLTDDPEFPQYLSWRFGNHASEALRACAFANAAKWSKCALIADPLDQDAQNAYAFLEDVSAAAREFEVLRGSEVVAPLKRRAVSKLIAVSKFDDETFDPEATIDELLADLGSYAPSDIVASIDWVKNGYPATYRLDSGFYSQLEGFVRRGAGGPSAGSAASGCLLPALAVLAVAALILAAV